MEEQGRSQGFQSGGYWKGRSLRPEGPKVGVVFREGAASPLPTNLGVWGAL